MLKRKSRGSDVEQSERAKKKQKTIQYDIIELPFELGMIIYGYAHSNTKIMMRGLSKAYLKEISTLEIDAVKKTGEAWLKSLDYDPKMCKKQLDKLQYAIGTACRGYYHLIPQKMDKRTFDKVFDAAAVSGHFEIVQRLISRRSSEMKQQQQQQKQREEQVRLINRALFEGIWSLNRMFVTKVLQLAVMYGKKQRINFGVDDKSAIPTGTYLGRYAKKCWTIVPKQRIDELAWTGIEFPPPLEKSETFFVRQEDDTFYSRVQQAQCLILCEILSYCGQRYRNAYLQHMHKNLKDALSFVDDFDVGTPPNFTNVPHNKYITFTTPNLSDFRK